MKREDRRKVKEKKKKVAKGDGANKMEDIRKGRRGRSKEKTHDW